MTNRTQLFDIPANDVDIDSSIRACLDMLDLAEAGNVFIERDYLQFALDMRHTIVRDVVLWTVLAQEGMPQAEALYDTLDRAVTNDDMRREDKAPAWTIMAVLTLASPDIDDDPQGLINYALDVDHTYQLANLIAIALMIDFPISQYVDALCGKSYAEVRFPGRLDPNTASPADPIGTTKEDA